MTIHGDDNIWGATLYSHPADKAFRRLRDPEVFERVYRLLPDHAHWVDGEPITDPASMTSTSNTIREFVVDDIPTATGLVPLGDAFAFTNPSDRPRYRDRHHPLGRCRRRGRPGARTTRPSIATAWKVATDRRARPFVQATIDYDRVRAPEVEAAMEGRVHEHTDPAALGFTAMNNARHRDQFMYENYRDIATLNATTARSPFPKRRLRAGHRVRSRAVDTGAANTRRAARGRELTFQPRRVSMCFAQLRSPRALQIARSVEYRPPGG